jgi:hypothetical protein
MKIGIIDSGIEKTHRRLKNSIITDEVYFDLGDNSIKYDVTDYCGHGTSIASIIAQTISTAELCIVKIFNNSLITEEKQLIKAINWCIDNSVDVINMSLGIQNENPSRELHDMCLKAYEKNIIIVASAHYILSKPSYPAFYPYVFGVTEGRVSNSSEFGFIPDYPIEFVAKGDIHRIAHLNDSFKFSSGTSYACAYFTGIVANHIQQYPEISSIDEIRNSLIEKSNPQIVPTQSNMRYIDIPHIISNNIGIIAERLFDKSKLKKGLGRLALFPVSEKEMNSFLDFPEHSIAPISMYIDYPRSFSSKKEKIHIQDQMISNADILEFDTLVSGYFHENLLYANQKFGYDILRKIISVNKNIYLFDNRLVKSITNHPEFKGNIYCPEIMEEKAADILQFKNIGKVKTPVIAVIGTSNKQGKFTTQLRLKEILDKEGYRVSHISTEPQGELLGANFTFPIGLNSTVKIPPHTWDITIDALIKAMTYYLNPHIVIGGIQGWMIPLNLNFTHACDMLHFLNGLQPDALICAINPNDSIETIHRNVQAAQIMTRAKVLFYTITPWLRTLKKTVTGHKVITKQLLSEEELQQRIIYYGDILRLPVINIKDKHNDCHVLDAIEKYFSPTNNQVDL